MDLCFLRDLTSYCREFFYCVTLEEVIYLGHETREVGFTMEENSAVD